MNSNNICTSKKIMECQFQEVENLAYKQQEETIEDLNLKDSRHNNSNLVKQFNNNKLRILRVTIGIWLKINSNKKMKEKSNKNNNNMQQHQIAISL